MFRASFESTIAGWVSAATTKGFVGAEVVRETILPPQQNYQTCQLATNIRIPIQLKVAQGK